MIMKLLKNICVISILLITILLWGCQDWLQEDPLDALSEATFFQNTSDAMMALTGLYNASSVGDAAGGYEILVSTSATDDSQHKGAAVGSIFSGYYDPSEQYYFVLPMWRRAYTSIYRCNYFLQKIENVDIDTNLKAELIAEARFIRGYEYFLLSFLYGGVPLVKKPLTVVEANTIPRDTYEETVDFILEELTAAAGDLPATRPTNERGRILKGAAFAVKGKLLMINERWGEAAEAYKEVMDLGVHTIDPRFKKLFEEAGETSSEIIMSAIKIVNERPNNFNQQNAKPGFYGGYDEENATQELVNAFLCSDGLPIEESPLYDPENPFKNRDPRLYATLFLPQYTIFNGTLYLAHPELTNYGLKSLHGATGYGWKKFTTDGYTGEQGNSGDDIIHIRYAEVLLGYLESKLENGDPITQQLLDETINKVRRREEIQMTPVTETNSDKLREIIRRERRVEFALERYIRYIDIRRWNIFYDVMNVQFHGMKLTNDPENYTDFAVETTGPYRGHYKALNRTGSFKPGRHLVPIPQYEIDTNPNLVQNPGY